MEVDENIVWALLVSLSYPRNRLVSLYLVLCAGSRFSAQVWQDVSKVAPDMGQDWTLDSEWEFWPKYFQVHTSWQLGNTWLFFLDTLVITMVASTPIPLPSRLSNIVTACVLPFTLPSLVTCIHLELIGTRETSRYAHEYEERLNGWDRVSKG